MKTIYGREEEIILGLKFQCKKEPNNQTKLNEDIINVK
jgi:hypothetical protein